jgi:ring-1,2-phenylacetyl-CoA epoxidase subunit PaaB
VNSLDPRVKRLPIPGEPGGVVSKAPLDQLGTFEVFVQPKEGKPFQHEGIVHAPDRELAFVLAKEAFTRRFLCVSLFVADTRHVYVSPTTEGDSSALDRIAEVTDQPGTTESYEIFVLPKRGKQHVHVGQVKAALPQEAMWKAKQENLHQGKVVYNVWAIRTADIRFTTPEEKDLWLTLPEKKFRDASDYKGGDKLKEFLERTKTA